MTKRFFMMVALLAATPIVMGQNTYINDQLTATDDVNGTARYVGMGGAMGALGADLSVISSNPAGIGLYRKNDIGLTFGVVVPNNANGWDKDNADRTYNEKLARASFDQIGLVWSLNTGSPKLKYVNFAFNYQKKANYNQGFYADNLNLGGLSQMDQLAELANAGFDTDYNLAGMAKDYGYLSGNEYAPGQTYIFNDYAGERSQYTRHQRGSNKAFDFNVSFNVKDRFYTGMTVGVDKIDYLSWSSYLEENQNGNGDYGDYMLYNDRDIDGHGVNVKWGFIVRPVESNPFRIGLAIETPTWYRLKSSTLYDISDLVDGSRTDTKETFIETTVRTPWRVRLSMGSTVDKILAWGAEYEYANAAKNKMGYPTWDDDGYHSSYANTTDKAMNALTKDVMKGQHTLKLGMEVKPVDAVAIRVGYNFVSSRYKKNPYFDQYSLDSYAMNYQTSTDFMTLGAANIVTFGVGYKYKKFYADLAYKFRAQSAKFHAFDTSFTASGSDFAIDFPDLADSSIEPVDIDLNRHQLMLSVGFKF